MTLKYDLIVAMALITDKENVSSSIVDAVKIRNSDRTSETRLIRLCDALDAAAPTLSVQLNGLRRHFKYFNDPATTLDQIKAVFNRAIEAAA